MNKYCVIWLLLLPNLSYCQKADFIIIESVRGYVFPINHNVLVGNLSEDYRFKPSTSELKVFEYSLKNEIGELIREFQYTGKGCPNIQKKLKRYARQYFGFINEDKDKILYVSFIWSKNRHKISEDLRTSSFDIYGGCSKYWRIKYNLSTKEFYDLYINEPD